MLHRVRNLWSRHRRDIIVLSLFLSAMVLLIVTKAVIREVSAAPPDLRPRPWTTPISVVNLTFPTLRTGSLRKVLVFCVHMAIKDYTGVTRETQHIKYMDGLLLNLQYAPFFYPGYEVRVYMADDLDPADIDRVRRFNSLHPPPPAPLVASNITVELFPAPSVERAGIGNAWRFVVFDDPSVDIVLPRDADSLPNPREVAAVNAWLASGTLAHAMHDNSDYYSNLFLAGTSGFRREALGPFLKAHGSVRQYFTAQEWAPREFDQEWLDAQVWPVVYTLDSYVAHAQLSLIRGDTRMRCTAFPTPRISRIERAASGPIRAWQVVGNYTIDDRSFERSCLIAPDMFPYG